VSVGRDRNGPDGYAFSCDPPMDHAIACLREIRARQAFAQGMRDATVRRGVPVDSYIPPVLDAGKAPCMVWIGGNGGML
jgi:hypothetical protein